MDPSPYLKGVVGALVAVFVLALVILVLRDIYDSGYNTGWRCAKANSEYYECKRRTE